MVVSVPPSKPPAKPLSELRRREIAKHLIGIIDNTYEGYANKDLAVGAQFVYDLAHNDAKPTGGAAANPDINIYAFFSRPAPTTVPADWQFSVAPCSLDDNEKQRLVKILEYMHQADPGVSRRQLLRQGAILAGSATIFKAARDRGKYESHQEKLDDAQRGIDDLQRLTSELQAAIDERQQLIKNGRVLPPLTEQAKVKESPQKKLESDRRDLQYDTETQSIRSKNNLAGFAIGGFAFTLAAATILMDSGDFKELAKQSEASIAYAKNGILEELDRKYPGERALLEADGRSKSAQAAQRFLC